MDARPLWKWVGGLLARDSRAPLPLDAPCLAEALPDFRVRFDAHGRPVTVERWAGLQYRITPIPERLQPLVLAYWKDS